MQKSTKEEGRPRTTPFANIYFFSSKKASKIRTTMKLTDLLIFLTLSQASAFSAVRPPSRSKTTQLHMTADSKPRVVVTGLGVISGCGIGHEDFFQACLDGKSSLGKVQRFDISHYPCQIASEVPESMFVAADHFMNPKNARSNDRYTHFAVAAARQALKDAGVGDVPETLENPKRIGVMIGSAFGGMETFEQETLKLAAKPDRPKVRLCRTVTMTYNVSRIRKISFSFELVIGVALYHPCSSG